MSQVKRYFTVIVGVAVLSVVAGCSTRRVDYEIRVDRPAAEPRHVAETATFASGEKFRLRITTHEDGYLYVLNKGSTGRWNVLFPRPEINGGSNFVKSWSHVLIPTEGRGAFQFDLQPGVETMTMCVSGKPVPALDTVARGQETDSARIEALLQRIEADATRGGAFEKVHHPDHTQIILSSPAPDAVMVNTVKLTHRPLGQ